MADASAPLNAGRLLFCQGGCSESDRNRSYSRVCVRTDCELTAV
jgi:hypothetical protein